MLKLTPRTGIVICWDEGTFRRQFSVSDGWIVICIKQGK